MRIRNDNKSKGQDMTQEYSVTGDKELNNKTETRRQFLGSAVKRAIVMGGTITLVSRIAGRRESFADVCPATNKCDSSANSCRGPGAGGNTCAGAGNDNECSNDNRCDGTGGTLNQCTGGATNSCTVNSCEETAANTCVAPSANSCAVNSCHGAGASNTCGVAPAGAVSCTAAKNQCVEGATFTCGGIFGNTL